MENKPLAERLRPKTLDDYIGQQHLVGKGKVLRKMIESGVVSSFILWGPPGVGKTTLAMIVAEQLKRPFYVLSAVSSGVNPPVFQGTARFFIGRSRKGNRYPDRSYDRKSFVRGDFAFTVPLSGICPEISGKSRSGRLDRPCGYDRFLSERKEYRCQGKGSPDFL